MQNTNSKCRNRRNPKELAALRNQVFEMLEFHKHEIEIRAQLKLSKAQYNSYLLDFFQEVLAGKRTLTPCPYEAEYANALPVSIQKMLAADKDDVVKIKQIDDAVLISIIKIVAADDSTSDEKDSLL